MIRRWRADLGAELTQWTASEAIGGHSESRKSSWDYDRDLGWSLLDVAGKSRAYDGYRLHLELSHQSRYLFC